MYIVEGNFYDIFLIEKVFNTFISSIVSIVKGGNDMNETLLRTDKEKKFTDIYNKYVDDIFRLCFTYLKNKIDTEDAVQEVFIKLLNHKGTFESEAHTKAWLVVTASNHCKDFLRHWWRKRKDIDAYADVIGNDGIVVDEMMELIMKLPDKNKTVIYLYYYEGYNSRQIANMLHKPDSTIRGYLSTAKKMLKDELI